MAALFDSAQDGEQFGRLDLADFAVSDDGVGEFEQPYQLADGPIGTTLASGLVEPLFGNCLEAVHIGKRAGDLVDLALGGGIDALCDLFLDLQPFGARLGEGDGRIDPQRGCRSLFSKAIVDPPAPLTGLRHQQVQAAPVRELVGLVARDCLSDCQIGKHEATFLPVSIPSKIPSDTVNCNDFSRIPVDARSVKSL